MEMKLETVPNFRTPEWPDPKRGASLKMKVETVPHFGTPEWPDPKR